MGPRANSDEIAKGRKGSREYIQEKKGGGCVQWEIDPPRQKSEIS